MNARNNDWTDAPGILLGECYACGTTGPLRQTRFGDFCADECLETPTFLRKRLVGQPVLDTDVVARIMAVISTKEDA